MNVVLENIQETKSKKGTIKCLNFVGVAKSDVKVTIKVNGAQKEIDSFMASAGLTNETGESLTLEELSQL